MQNKLFIVEGLPCVGKSTTSKYLAGLLEDRGCKVKWQDEGTGNHLADYEFHSYITKKEFERFSKEEQQQILKVSNLQLEGYIVPLNQFQGELFQKLLKHKIYDFLPWEQEKPVMLKGWREFAKHANEQEIYIFNCCLLQNPMCETMMRFNLPYEQSKAYISEILNEIKALQPVIIYLSQSHIAERISAIAGKRDAEWLAQVIDYHVSGAYGQTNHLIGFEGDIQCLKERQEREIKLLEELNITHMIIQDPYEDWCRTYKAIEGYISKHLCRH